MAVFSKMSREGSYVSLPPRILTRSPTLPQTGGEVGGHAKTHREGGRSARWDVPDRRAVQRIGVLGCPPTPRSRPPNHPLGVARAGPKGDGELPGISEGDLVGEGLARVHRGGEAEPGVKRADRPRTGLTEMVGTQGGVESGVEQGEWPRRACGVVLLREAVTCGYSAGVGSS